MITTKPNTRNFHTFDVGRFTVRSPVGLFPFWTVLDSEDNVVALRSTAETAVETARKLNLDSNGA